MYYRSSRDIVSSSAALACQSETHVQSLPNICSNLNCHHKTDEEKALTGTWAIDEVCLAVQKGYRILEIHEVYEYNVNRYEPETLEVGLFAGYIDTYLN